MKLQKPFEDYLAVWEKSSLRSIDFLLSQVDSHYAFADPYHDVFGKDHAQKILTHRYTVLKSMQTRIHDIAWGRQEGTAYFFWTSRYQYQGGLLVKSSRQAEIEGTTRLQFTQDGKIFSHQEFWGAHPNFNQREYVKILKEVA